MKTYKVIFTVFVAMILGAFFVVTGCSNEEINQSERTLNHFERISLNKEKLNHLDERGKIMYDIIISMKQEKIILRFKD